MTTKKLTILQVGEKNWEEELPLSDTFEWLHISASAISEFVAEEKAALKLAKKKKKKARKLSALLLTDQDYPEEIADLSALFEVYEVFYPQDFCPQNAWTQAFLRQKMAQRFDDSQREELLHKFEKGLFVGQYGAKLPVVDLQISEHFTGNVSWQGHAYVHLDGNYGADKRLIATFPYNVPAQKASFLELQIEHIKDATCEIQVLASLIPGGATDYISQEWLFEGDELAKPLVIDADQDGTLNVSILASGHGKLSIGPLHYRWGRNGLGQFILGGERYADQKMQEFMYYFDPVDFKPPLCVYFSGFRTAEGFEGFWMMKSLKTPFMLICDPRLQGGSFYLGSPEYEQKIVDVIQEKLDFLGFSSDQLILSGLSMGTFGATYHGAKLQPHAIIIGKPVLNLGTVAQRERITRPGGFPTSLDVQQQFLGDLSQASSEALDNRFWERFRQADFSHTKFAVAYMKDDDYDGTGFQDMLSSLGENQRNIIGRGWSGRHGDAVTEVPMWFMTQYHNILKNDFGRIL